MRIKSLGIVGLWIGFIILIIFLGRGLMLNPNLLPSQLIGKPFPNFELYTLSDEPKLMVSEALKGEPYLVHVWATWCGVCLQEHPIWLEIQEKWQPKIIGVSYKDPAKRALHWLNTQGNPYFFDLDDKGGKLGLELGVYGTPETYVVDDTGIIRYRHVGAISLEQFENHIQPLLKPQEKG